jgi:FAD/FMN-containing dehydrogenase
MDDLPTKTIEKLEANLRGTVIRPGAHGYDAAREVWNARIDRKPALIARCLGNHDVIETLRFARENDLVVAVKGGGHNIGGNGACDDGVVIDLSPMRWVYVDPKAKTVRAGGGCLLGDVDRETELHGLAVSAGIVSHTGVGGLSLGGGFGWISRKYGLTVDNILGGVLVSADGDVLAANAEENPDLYWGIRGGGGNFGVATSLELRCAEIGREVFSGLIVHRFEDAKDYIQFHRDYVRTLPDEASIWMVVRRAPPLPFLPESVHGKMVVVVPFVCLTDPGPGAKLIEPVRAFGRPHGEHFGMNPWSIWQSTFDGLNGPGKRNYWKSHNLTELADPCVDKILEFAASAPTPDCEVFIPHMEGAPSHVAEGATAFAFRQMPFVLNVHTRWSDPSDDERCIAWAENFFESTKPFAKGVYVNFVSDEGEERVKDAYSRSTMERLVELKNKYDPTNLFRMNQNIKPTV